MTKVVFDSNVWEKVIDTEKYLDDPSIDDLKRINSYIQDKTIQPFLSDVIFNLEAIKKKDRKEYLKKGKGIINVKSSKEEDGWVTLSFSIEPSEIHPGNHKILDNKLQIAISMGFRIINSPRIGGYKNPDIPTNYYYADDTASMSKLWNTQAEAQRYIEHELNCGIYHIKKIGEKYKRVDISETWMDGVSNAPEKENTRIIKAVAEWADADAVAAHIGLPHSFFCTRDLGRSTILDSVFSPKNKEKLEEKFKARIVSPEQLIKTLS